MKWITKAEEVLLACVLLVTGEVSFVPSTSSASMHSESKMKNLKREFDAPDFWPNDVISVLNFRAPPGYVQLNISWDGLDTSRRPFLAGTNADIYIDGIPTGYQVDALQSTNLYVTNEVHAITLEVNGVITSHLVSQVIQTTAPFPLFSPGGALFLNGPPELVAATNPELSCAGSGETSGAHPGWKSNSAIKLTVVVNDPNSYGIYWCPAAAPHGIGPISYTVTASPGAITCETTDNSCVLPGTLDGKNFAIMATDQTASYSDTTVPVANSGTITFCPTTLNWCNLNPVIQKFPTHGNVVPEALGDCTFAAVADWEEVEFGFTPDPKEIRSEFNTSAGKLADGFSNDQLFSYWHNSGIAGLYLQSHVNLPIDPESVKNAIDSANIKAVIAQLHFDSGDNFAGYQLGSGGYHWIVVDGYTPTGPVVVTWGQTLQMTWQQWNIEALNMWSLSIR